MYFPKLNAPRQSRVTVNRFPGLDRRPRGQEGSFREMENLCAQGYPTLTVRRPRGVAGSVTAPGGLTAKDGLIWVDGHTLYINGSAAGLVLSEGRKQLISMGAWLLIWPDKAYINTKDLTDFGSLENKRVTEGEVSFALCRPDGTVYSGYLAADEAPEEPEAGSLWLDTGGDETALRQYGEDGWTAVDDVCVRMNAAGIGIGFTAGDGVAVSGCRETALNGSFPLRSVEDDYVVVTALPRSIERNNAVNQMNALLDEFIDAKEYGSILQPGEYDWALLSRFVADTTPEQQVTFDESGVEATQAQLRLMIAQGQALAQKYHVVVTNPPYMSSGNMGAKLLSKIKKEFDVGKNDTYSAFIIKCRDFAKENGFYAMITMQGWMFTQRFEELRKLLLRDTLCSMLHVGYNSFPELNSKIAQGASFSFRKKCIKRYVSIYYDLTNRVSQSADKKQIFENKMKSNDCIEMINDKFTALPGCQFAYWITPALLNDFSDGIKLGDIAAPRQGLATGDNDTFLRFWHEVAYYKLGFSYKTTEEFQLSNKLYTPYNKGGEYCKWYGNRDLVIKFDTDNYDILQNQGNHLPSKQYYFSECATWSALTTSGFSCRYCENGFVFDTKGSSLFCNNRDELLTYMGFLNSIVANEIFKMLSPTVDYNAGTVANVPILSRKNERVNYIVGDNIEKAKRAADSFETSWDFKEHPLIRWSRCLGDATSIGATIQYYYGRRMPVSCPLELCYLLWQGECNKRFEELKSNEEELNRIFIDIYGLQDELTPDVDDKDVTVRKADLSRDIRSLISYAVGCMVGRYSIYKKGLMFAGGDWSEEPFLQALWDDAGMQYVQAEGNMTPMMDLNPQKVVMPDEDGILPITDDEYFYDDIVTLFVNWVRIVYGEATLEENLKFISDALGGKGSPREVIRNYFLNDFYKDHLKVYQKRPIYWLFDSGKKNGFKALIYMHRYQPDTIARVRTDYVHEMQSRYRTAIADVEQRINGASTSERVKLTKRLTVLQAQAEELRLYEEKIHHLADQMIAIDLDDGVKVNYAKFADVLATIK